MPNWCSNRMYFSAEPAQITEIKRLASGAVTPLYRRATNEGIQLFLAGSAGLLQTTEDVRFEPCPGLTVAGRGVVSPENIAFTRWLTHLQNGVLLDEQKCLMLHELWQQSGTGQRRWEGLPDEVRENITVHFTAKRGDWCGFWSTGGMVTGHDDVPVTQSGGAVIPAQFLHRVQHPRRSDPRVWSHVTQPAGHAGERHRFSHARLVAADKSKLLRTPEKAADYRSPE